MQSSLVVHGAPITFLHALVESHICSPVHVSGSNASTCGWQTPVPLHVAHVPLQSLVQQTPSRHVPVSQNVEVCADRNDGPPSTSQAAPVWPEHVSSPMQVVAGPQ